jgi:hypothetical protein
MKTAVFQGSTAKGLSLYKVTGFVKGEGKVEKTIIASSAKEAAEFFKKQLGTPKVSVTVVSVIMEAQAKEIEEEKEGGQ